MSKFTPGPWDFVGPFRLYGQPPMRQVFSRQSFSWVAWVQHEDSTGQEALSNAQLIAAAPDMYQALQRIVQEYGDIYRHNGTVGPYQQAVSALAKADGKATLSPAPDQPESPLEP